jgi:hypothetical protein
VSESGSATVLSGKGKVGIFEEEVGEEDKFRHEDGEGEFLAFPRARRRWVRALRMGL